MIKKTRNKLYVTVGWKKYISIKNVVLNKYLEKYGDGFLINTLNITKNAIIKKTPALVLIRFSKSDIISIATRHEYPLVLQRLLELCLFLEKYEICQMITDAQNELIAKEFLTTKKKQHENILI